MFIIFIVVFDLKKITMKLKGILLLVLLAILNHSVYGVNTSI